MFPANSSMDSTTPTSANQKDIMWDTQFQYGGLPSSPDTTNSSGYFSNSFGTVSSPDLSMHNTTLPSSSSPSISSQTASPMNPKACQAESYANWTFTSPSSSGMPFYTQPPVYQNWTASYGNYMAMQQVPAAPYDPRLITITLHNQSVWKAIGAQVIEMMVTNQGRQINPRIILSVSHLQDLCEYEFGMKLVLQSQNVFQVKRLKENGEVKEYWEEVKLRNKQDVEKETIEIFFGKKSGVEMQKKEQTLLVKIYNVGDEKKKGANAKCDMSEEARIEAEKRDEKRAQSMFKVALQHKYMPIVTLYQIPNTGFQDRNQVAQVSLHEAQFIASAGYKTKVMKLWKTETSVFARSDYKENVKKEKKKDFGI